MAPLESCKDNLSIEKFVINDDGLKRFCELSVNILSKHAPRKKRNWEEIRCHFLQKKFLKKLTLDPDLVTNTLKTEIKTIEPYMLNKAIIVYLCYEIQKEVLWKLRRKKFNG